MCVSICLSDPPLVLGVQTAKSHTADGVVSPEKQPVNTNNIMSHLALRVRSGKFSIKLVLILYHA